MGEFDSKCASAVREARHRFPEKQLRLVLVLPYMTNRVNTDKNLFETEYDDVMIPIELADVHPKPGAAAHLFPPSYRRLFLSERDRGDLNDRLIICISSRQIYADNRPL